MIKAGDIINVRSGEESIVDRRIYHIKSEGYFNNGVKWVIYDIYYLNTSSLDRHDIKIDAEDMRQYIPENNNKGITTNFIDEAGLAKILLGRK